MSDVPEGINISVPPGYARWNGVDGVVDRIQETRINPSGSTEYAVRFRGRGGRAPWLRAADIAPDVLQRHANL